MCETASSSERMDYVSRRWAGWAFWANVGKSEAAGRGKNKNRSVRIKLSGSPVLGKTGRFYQFSPVRLHERSSKRTGPLEALVGLLPVEPPVRSGPHNYVVESTSGPLSATIPAAHRTPPFGRLVSLLLLCSIGLLFSVLLLCSSVPLVSGLLLWCSICSGRLPPAPSTLRAACRHLHPFSHQ